ncbi:accessory factor associated with RNA polymerase II [Thecaphora frezii]
MAAPQPDPLQTLLSAFRSDPAHPLAPLTFLDASGSRVDTIVAASTLHVSLPSPSSSDAPIALAKAQPTRLARSKETLASRLASASPPTVDAEPDLFFTVEALVLAVQLRDERAGAYLAQAASARVASVPALDRNGILEFLLGKRTEWAGVLPLGDVAPSGATGAQPAGSAVAAAAGQMAGQAAGVKRAYAPNRADIEFVKRLKGSYEVVLRIRNDALRGNSASINGGAAVSRIRSAKFTDFGAFRTAFAAKLEAARKAGGSAGRSGGGGVPGSVSSRLPTSGSAGQARRQRAQDPIIVISNSPTSLLNMFNIKQYLEEGIFVPPEEARTKARGVADLVVSITSRGGGPNSAAAGGGGGTGIGRRILVVDNAEAVNRLGGGSVAGPAQDPWNRVVAVFTTGQAWQFRTYKWAEPRELFKNVMGVYVRWHNEPQNINVREWNVTELQVDRTKRHTDKQVVAFFWRSLETWTQRRKPQLLT